MGGRGWGLKQQKRMRSPFWKPEPNTQVSMGLAPSEGSGVDGSAPLSFRWPPAAPGLLSNASLSLGRWALGRLPCVPVSTWPSAYGRLCKVTVFLQ